MFIGFQHY